VVIEPPSRSRWRIHDGVARVYAFEETNDALAHVGSGRIQGKVVVSAVCPNCPDTGVAHRFYVRSARSPLPSPRGR